MEPFATYADYAARYDPGDVPEERVTVLLGDASAVISAQLPSTADTAALSALLKSVTCAMVSRAVNAGGDMAGISQYSEGAAGMSASMSFANPNGDLYLTSQEREALGIGGGMVGFADLCGAR